MKPFEEQLVGNAIRLSWVVLFLVIIMVCSGIVLCFFGTRDPSTFSFIGLKLSSSQVGLFVVAMGIAMFFMEKRIFEMLVNPRSILSLGSRISKVRLSLNEAYEKGETRGKETPGNKTISTNKQTNIHLRTVYMKLIIEIALTVGLLVFSLVVLSTQPNTDLAKIAAGLIGVVLGYWLK